MVCYCIFKAPKTVLHIYGFKYVVTDCVIIAYLSKIKWI